MRPQFQKVAKAPGHSFSVRQDLIADINSRWHYHDEVELIHFKKGEGTQFIGDSIKEFKSGDVVLVGSNLPHYWKFDDIYFNKEKCVTADVRVIHFNENFWGENFLCLPENNNLKCILEKSKRGIQITGKPRQTVAELLEQMLICAGIKRIIYLMEALSSISDCKILLPLSSIGFKPNIDESENDRINAIYEYTLKNFKGKIQLEKIAEVANISPNSFCRYFKTQTTKTYSQFLMEFRVGQACKLLIEKNQCIKLLCYESGFNNFTSFHKSFKMITGKSPLIYQKEFTSNQ